MQRQPQLARTLARMAEAGASDLYRGALAAEIARFFREEGGLVTAEDLAAYRVVSRRPLLASYRGVQVTTNPPPSSGGTLLGYALGVHDRVPPGADPLDAQTARTIAAVLRDAERRRTPALSSRCATAVRAGCSTPSDWTPPQPRSCASSPARPSPSSSAMPRTAPRTSRWSTPPATRPR